MIEAKRLTKAYMSGEFRVNALKGASLEVLRGEFIAVMGASGSGKSTLMNLLGCLDTPDYGQYWLDGEDVSCLSQKRLAGIRNRKIGFVFQSFNLLHRLSAVANVELPLMYAGIAPKERKRMAEMALDRVGLWDRMEHKPDELSGGQKQRVAIARSIAMNPAVILADEPTGNLDEKTGREMLDLFCDLNGQGATIVMVTHEMSIARRSNRIIRLSDGRIDDGWQEAWNYGSA
ncbi:MAG: ABC transporter ATP-binding protein [Clostridiales bacterium]|jgi:putative ABC transport system ATP-binding protein|nr:ABC transporter ATP-binding protein [Clostridiales bacterium]